MIMYGSHEKFLILKFSIHLLTSSQTELLACAACKSLFFLNVSSCYSPKPQSPLVYRQKTERRATVPERPMAAPCGMGCSLEGTQEIRRPGEERPTAPCPRLPAGSQALPAPLHKELTGHILAGVRELENKLVPAGVQFYL